MKRYIQWFCVGVAVASMAGCSDRSVGYINDINSSGIIHNGFTYGVVQSPYTGKIWLDRNIGASRVCESFDDVACYGGYFQWGRNADGHEDLNLTGDDYIYEQATDVTNVGHSKFISNTIFNKPDWAAVDSNGTIRSANWSKTDGSSVCPEGFRVPTIAELKAELFDPGSAEIQNIDDAFNSFLKLPAAGFRDPIAITPMSIGTAGALWSSSVSENNVSTIMYFENSASWFMTNRRIYGEPVRCLKD